MIGTTKLTVDLNQFREQGYFVFRGLLNPQTDLQPIREEYSVLLDSLAEKWFAEGKMSSAYRGIPFGQKVAKITAEGQFLFQEFDISLPAKLKIDTPIHLGPAVFNLLRNPHLLDTVECLIGPEIYSNPVQHVRIKPPEHVVPASLWNGNTAAVGWHQDLGVVEPEADDSDMLSVWVAITDATLENGCLQIAPGSHRGGVRLHCRNQKYEGLSSSTNISIPDSMVGERCIPIPMGAGDALFFDKKLMHSSLPNTSDDIRWSFDLRYNPIGQATGRPWLPGFVARSRAHPETELTNHARWVELWSEARQNLCTGYTSFAARRWAEGDPRCA